jgi:hypothetical protein
MDKRAARLAREAAEPLPHEWTPTGRTRFGLDDAAPRPEQEWSHPDGRTTWRPAIDPAGAGQDEAGKTTEARYWAIAESKAKAMNAKFQQERACDAANHALLRLVAAECELVHRSMEKGAYKAPEADGPGDKLVMLEPGDAVRAMCMETLLLTRRWLSLETDPAAVERGWVQVNLARRFGFGCYVEARGKTDS